jgi:cell division protein FtsA
MKNLPLNLFLEITGSTSVFFVCEVDEQNNCKIIYKSEIPLKGINNSSVSDFEIAFSIIKDSLIKIEQNLNQTFKEIILILENYNSSFVNISGYKKLNSSQILRENITYILNSLKSYVDETEKQKNFLHIFNSRFQLDNKKIDNLPIGLFGDFYSHELSFILINSNDNKNINNIFERCNLKIKKILVKSFIKGAHISNNYKNTESFFYIKISDNNSKIFYFENNSLKSEETFKFGIDIIMRDISKITTLKIETVKKILGKIKFEKNITENEFIDQEFLNEERNNKVKKKLIYDIILARLEEIAELIIFNNINFNYYNKNSRVIFLEIDNALKVNGIKDIFEKVFSYNETFELKVINDLSNDKMISTINQLVHFGWKKEAIPISMSRKSIVSRIFDKIFG